MPAAAQETRQYCAEQVRGVNRAKRTIEIVASDFSRDSYGTRIDQAGWDLAQFLKNPAILGCHNDRQFALARAIPETVKVEGQTLSMTIEFPDEGKHPEADIAFDLYADGFMRGVSVGFVPLEWEDVDEPDEDGNVMRVRIFRKQRLLEVSLVAIPSNDNALAQRAAKLNADPLAARRKTEQLEKRLEKPLTTSAVTTLRIKDVAVKVAVQEGDLEAFEKEFSKVAGYFDKKQPANRAATKVLAKFFKTRGLEHPAEEIEAWERMAELLDEAPAEAVKAEEAPAPALIEETTPEEKPAEQAPATETPAEAPAEEKKEEEKPIEEAAPAAEEPIPSPTPNPAAAPQVEQKASVLITPDALRQLPGLLGKRFADVAAEALRQGKPVSEVGGVLRAESEKLQAQLFHS